MAKNYTFTEMADAAGVTPVELAVETIRREGSLRRAAKLLGVTPRSLSYHLHKAGLRTVTKRTVHTKTQIVPI